MRRANDPQRREKIIQATLEAVKLYGIHAVTHRKIATLAGVPLGSMTYYFSGIDELLLEAFSRFTEIMSRQYQAFFSDVSDAPGACQAITDMIYSSQVATPDNMELMYQLYALASRKPLLKTVMQNWMQRSQQTLEQWFEPGTARALDAFIEGMTLHFVTDRKPRCAIPLPDAETYSLIVLHVKKKNISSTGQNTHFQKLAIDVGSVASGLNRNAVSR